MTNDRWFEQPGDELDDREYPDDDDYDDDDHLSETVACPECGAEIYEDAVRCPACGQYVTPGAGSLWTGRSPWWILLALAGIAAVIWVFLTPAP